MYTLTLSNSVALPDGWMKQLCRNLKISGKSAIFAGEYHQPSQLPQ
jgi:hypothetical protein